MPGEMRRPGWLSRWWVWVGSSLDLIELSEPSLSPVVLGHVPRAVGSDPRGNLVYAPFVGKLLWRARPRVRELEVGINELGDPLQVTVKPHMEILEWSVNGSSAQLLIVTVLLTGLFILIPGAG
jgi:hypothetical protein